MSIVPGTRIGPYEVTGAIGAGGMGEVYRAHDTKLGRDVALKVLPDAVADDHERLARFKREAQVLASLNHPHIAQIFGVEDSAGVPAIVMELVAGPTLDERIAKTGLPIADALHIARQIADALAAAHDHGVIHRDLKPSNIKVSEDGDVKVLDFGLAKPTGPEDDLGHSSPMLTQSPTLTSPANTALGLILGTAAYMAPEQAKGHRVDKRADIWAFGCVLYEMLTGRRAFEGEDVSDTLAAVLRGDPDWTALPRDLPPAIRLLLERCLTRDRKRRIADISTALFLMTEPSSVAPTPAERPSAPRRGSGLLIAVGAACAIAGAALSALSVQFFRRPTDGLAERLSIVLPADRPMAFPGTPNLSLAISPNGTDVVYVSANPDAPPERASQLRVRSLASAEVRDLPGTFRSRQPFFSPDGRWIGFFTQDGELKKIALAGGNPVTLATKINGGNWSFGVWLDDNTMVFGAANSDGLYRVSADAATNGAIPQRLTTRDDAHGERGHVPFSFLPAARAVLFITSFLDLRTPQAEVVLLSTGERRHVLDNVLGARLVGGEYLMVRRDDALLVAPFDQKTLAIAGSAVPLTEPFRSDGPAGEGAITQAAVSETGTLAYVPAQDDANQILGIVDRSGKFDPIDVPAGPGRRPRASPDGQHISYELPGPQNTVAYVYDVAQKTTRKLTESGSDIHATWFDNQSIAVYARRANGRGIYLKQIGGGERLLYANATDAILRPESFSPSGVLAFTRQLGSDMDIWLLTTGGTPTAKAFIDTPATEFAPRFSPNGRWLAYVANESGRLEVRLRAFPDGEAMPVSAAGGSDPVWSRDGRTLFFRVAAAGQDKLMAVPISDRGLIGPPMPVFDLKTPNSAGVMEILIRPGGNNGPNYDALPDGRFITSRGANPQSAREIVIVQNWFEELKRLGK